MNLIDFPKTPGTYVVWLDVEQTKTLQIGKLGTFTFNAGTYAYIGSAHGPGGLHARLSHHLRAEKKLHWHIDYLTTSAVITTIWWAASSERLECEWAQRVSALSMVSGVRIPVPGFGSSDCACESHLFSAPPEAAYNTLKASAPGLQITRIE